MKILRHLRELWQYRGLIHNLVVRDLKIRYKSSTLGIVWSWLNPLLMMIVYTILFTIILRRDDDIPYYHIFLLCGLLSWNFFNDSVFQATGSIVSNGHLIKKVYFPREVLPISSVLSNLVNFLIALPVFFILALFSGSPLTWWVLLLPITILIQVIFTIGLTLLLTTLNVFFRDTQIVLGVIMLACFFLTPVFYQIQDVPQQVTVLNVITFDAQLWLRRLNPMASIIASYRDLLYYGAPTGLDFLLRTAITALLVLIGGYLVFLRYSPRFGEEV
ncbi:MAG: ABC transporter permease [Chloroflexota bacterium]|nr:ABC transporter permease [Chloroflexota bacterium]